jgi:thioredoxin 1
MEKQLFTFFFPLITLLLLPGCSLSDFGYSAHKDVTHASSPEDATRQQESSVQMLHSTADFDALITTAEKPVVVKFGAPWCGACQEMEPILHHAAIQSAGKYIFAEVNIDEVKELATRFNIKGIPLTCLFYKGQEVAPNKRYVGVITASELLSSIDASIR